MKSAEDVMNAVAIGSHPARGAWIEMQYTGAHISRLQVAPRKGCVD